MTNEMVNFKDNEFLVWSLTEADLNATIENRWASLIPNYIRDSFKALKLHANQDKKYIDVTESHFSADFSDVTLPTYGSRAIKIKIEDEKHVMYLPGLLTNTDGTPRFTESARQRARLDNGESTITPIKWSGVRETDGIDPNDVGNHPVGYTHIVGICPIGYFLITWKSWKDIPDEYNPGRYSSRDSRMIDHTPFGQECLYGGETEAEAMETAEKHYESYLARCLPPGRVINDDHVLTVDDLPKHDNAMQPYGIVGGTKSKPLSNMPTMWSRIDQQSCINEQNVEFELDGQLRVGLIISIINCFDSRSCRRETIVGVRQNHPYEVFHITPDSITGIAVRDFYVKELNARYYNIIPRTGEWINAPHYGLLDKREVVEFDHSTLEATIISGDDGPTTIPLNQIGFVSNTAKSVSK